MLLDKFFYGLRTVKIKKYDDHQVQCENCHCYSVRYVVYQKYFHYLYIPIYPINDKTIKTVCLECGYGFNQEKSNYYINKTRTPFFLYSGIILVIGFVLSIFVVSSIYEKIDDSYIKNPKVGDVYRIRDDSNKQTIYYFEKLIQINSDTLLMLHSSLQYNSFITEMNDTDYFVKNDCHKLLKSELISHQDSGHINSVIRTYDIKSRFRIEK